MKEEWLMSGAVVPVDVDTTTALVAEIKRLIDVVGGLVLKQGPDYERGFVDGMQKQAQSSVDRAVNRMAQPEQEPVACRTLCELCIKRGYNFCANAAKTTPITTPPAAQPALLQVSPTEFVDMVMDKEDAIGKPLFWAEWPNREKNNAA
jgi:hypothetical protein